MAAPNKNQVIRQVYYDVDTCFGSINNTYKAAIYCKMIHGTTTYPKHAAICGKTNDCYAFGILCTMKCVLVRRQACIYKHCVCIFVRGCTCVYSFLCWRLCSSDMATTRAGCPCMSARCNRAWSTWVQWVHWAHFALRPKGPQSIGRLPIGLNKGWIRMHNI